MRAIFFSAFAIFAFTLAGFSQVHSQNIFATPEKVTLYLEKDGNGHLNPDFFNGKQEAESIVLNQINAAPMPILKEKGNGNTPVISGLDLSDFKPVAIPNKYQWSELITKPSKISRPKIHLH